MAVTPSHADNCAWRKAEAIVIAEQFDMSAEGAAALLPEYATDELASKLAASGLYRDALMLLSHAMPARAAIGWAYRCIKPTTPECATRCAIATWLEAAITTDYYGVKAEAEQAGIETPNGCLALAVFLSGPSLAPAGTPAVPPPTYAWSRTVANALLIAGVVPEPSHAAERYRAYIELALA